MTRARFRAVLLAAVMVLSVVAMGAGFAGGAAAQEAPAEGEVVLLNQSDDVVGSFESIQAAVDAASEANDTVVVGSGSYDAFDVDVDGLTIQGPNAGVAGDSDERDEEALVSLNNTERVDVIASSVEINGLAFEFAEQAIYSASGSSDSLYANNRFELANGTESQGYGVRFEGGTSDSKLLNNEFLDISNSVESEFGNGVVVAGPDGHVIAGNTFSNNSIGVNIGAKQPAKQLKIANNTFTQQDDTAIALNHDDSGDPNIDITENRIDSNEIGVLVLSGGSIDVSENAIVNNNQTGVNADYLSDGNVNATSNWWGSPAGPSTESNTYNVENQGDSVTGAVNVTPWLDAPDGNDFAPVEVNTKSYASIQAGADSGTNTTVRLVAGTYDENVSISNENVSVVGSGDETVIEGLVLIDGVDSALVDLAVEPEEFVRPDDGRIPSSERQAILVTASDAGVYDTSINVSLDANGGFEEVNAIQVFGGDPITNVQIFNNDITGTASNDQFAGVVGVSDQAETEETLVFNNSIDVDSEGYSFGVVTRASGGSNVEETPETVVVYNHIDATADAYPGVGYGIESTDEAQVNADVQVVKDNTFGDVDSIQHKADNGTLDITMNEWEDLENVSFITDGYSDAWQNGGEIVYDPFLTSAPPSPENFTPPGERTDFGHDLVVPADGEPHSVAFPAPVEGNVSEVFGDFNGTVYAYDGNEWKSGEEVADQDIDALDAFAVSVDEGEEDLRIDFAYAETDSPVPSMTTAELEQGWNFVGAPSGNAPSSEAFAGSTADITTVIDAIAGPESSTTPYGLDASGEVTNPSRVSPFKGYWVFVTDDGELGATVPVGPTQSNEEGALARN